MLYSSSIKSAMSITSSFGRFSKFMLESNQVKSVNKPDECHSVDVAEELGSNRLGIPDDGGFGVTHETKQDKTKALWTD